MTASKVILLGSQSYLARSFVEWLSSINSNMTDKLTAISRSNSVYNYLYKWLSYESNLLDPVFTKEISNSTLVHFSSALKPNTPLENACYLAARERIFNQRLAILCSTYRVRALIYISSGGALYGNTSAMSDESHAPNPISAYGKAKLDAERIFENEAGQGGWTFQSLRLSNPFGPLQLGVLTHGLIPALIRSAYSGLSFPLYGDGLATKDYLYVDDFCAALHAAVERPIGGPYNVSFGRSYSIRDLIREVEIAANRGINIRMRPALDGDVHDVHLSHERFAKLYGWCPSVSIREGISNMWDYYASQLTTRRSL